MICKVCKNNDCVSVGNESGKAVARCVKCGSSWKVAKSPQAKPRKQTIPKKK